MLPVIKATAEEVALHCGQLTRIQQISDGQCVWLATVDAVDEASC